MFSTKLLYIFVFLNLFAFSEILCSGFFTMVGEEIRDRATSAYGTVKEKIRDKSNCLYGECCVDKFVPGNFDGLFANLTEDLFGQHIVMDHLIKALKSHYMDSGISQKPLVLSLQGPSGTGKTYVADRVASFMYKLGGGSRFVHKFTGRIDFPTNDKVEDYKKDLQAQIYDAIKACPKSLFIFDEVEKMPNGIFELIPSYLDCHQEIKGLNFRQAVYMFISNAHGDEIAVTLLDLLKNGHLREDTTINNFEEVLQLIAYNDGGLKKSSLIDGNLISYYIPFLPLEKRHVEQCIRWAFSRRGKHPTDEIVQKISSEYVTYAHGIFAKSGCKRIDSTVGIYAADL